MNFKVDEQQDNSELMKYRENVNVFTGFVKKVLPVLEKHKKELKQNSKSVNESYLSYKNVYSSMVKFEDLALDFFNDNDINKRTLTHPGMGDVKGKVAETID